MTSYTTTQSNMMMLLGRVLLALLFITSGFAKFMAAAATKAYFAKIGVPAPGAAYIVAVAIELGGGILFLLGVRTRTVAAVLATFTVATALLAHTHFADMQQKTQFLKNLAIAGGFLGFAVLGGGTYSVDGQMSRRGNGRVMARRGEVTAFD